MTCIAFSTNVQIIFIMENKIYPLFCVPVCGALNSFYDTLSMIYYMWPGLRKSVLLPVSRFNFSSWTEWYMNKLINFIFKTSYTWVVCFCWLLFWAVWRSVWAVWCPNGGFASLGLVVSGCMLNKGVCCKFPLILASLKTCVAHNLA